MCFSLIASVLVCCSLLYLYAGFYISIWCTLTKYVNARTKGQTKPAFALAKSYLFNIIVNTATVQRKIFLLPLKAVLHNWLLTISTTTRSTCVSIFFCFMRASADHKVDSYLPDHLSLQYSIKSLGIELVFQLRIQWENLSWISANAPSQGLIWQGQTESISPHLLRARHGWNAALSSCQNSEVGSSVTKTLRLIN